MTDAAAPPVGGANTPETRQNRSTPRATTRRTIQIADYQPHPRNYNRHPADQLKRIGHSLETFGQVRSIVVWRGYFLAGHGVAEAARLIGWSTLEADELPDDYPEAKALAYVAADNELSRLADPDAAQLAAILQESREADPALMAAIGYTDAELADLLARIEEENKAAKRPTGDTEPQIDKAEELRQKWNVEPGQLWQLGEHRIICGDCTDPAIVARVMAGEKADAMITDPPYCSGGFQEAGKKAGSIGTRGDEMIANDTLSTRGYIALMKSAILLSKVGVLYVFTDWRMWINLFDVAESSGYGVRQMIVWDKGTPGMGRGWRSQHELILAAMKVAQPFDPKKAQGNVIKSERTGNVNHATEKPVDLIATILDVTDMAQTIYDPFSGSGTTLIACTNLGRKCRAVEISPAYVAVAIERWVTHTGDTPQLLEAAP